MSIPLLNDPRDLAVARQCILRTADRLERVERELLRLRLDRETYLDKFARADELRRLLEEMEKFVSKKEREE